MKKQLSAILLVLCASCSKEKDNPRCWICTETATSTDNSSHVVLKQEPTGMDTTFCDKTKAEVKDLMGKYTRDKPDTVNGVSASTSYTLSCKEK